jgi:PKD repeat protein/uncharacterized membrane protein
MKKSVVILVLILISSGFAGMIFPDDISVSGELVAFGGPTYIGGVINADTVWNSTNSPYIIYKNTTVMPDKILTIEAGTAVKFNNNTQLNIRGTLIVKGNSTNKVVFTANGTMYSYSSMNYRTSESYPGKGVSYKIYIDVTMGGSIKIEHAKFEYSSSTALSYGYLQGYDGKQDIITDTIFSNNYRGFDIGNIYRLMDGMDRCTFKNNYIGLYAYYKIINNAIFKNNSFGCNSLSRIYNSHFNNNSIGAHTGYVYNSTFQDNKIGVDNAYEVKYCTLTTNEVAAFNSNLIKNSVLNNTIGIETNYYARNNNIYNNTKYNVKLISTTTDANLTGNWWGTTNTTIIDKYIYDVWDEANLHEGIYKPFSTKPIKITNEPPIANAGPDINAKVNDTVYFNGASSSDPDMDTMIFQWDYGDGTKSIPSTNPYSGKIYSQVGIYNVTLTVSDGIFESKDYCMVNITKINFAPVANAGPDQTVKVGDTVYFDGNNSYDPDGDPLTYYWSFGDGKNSSTWPGWSWTTHKYTSAGTYKATLRVNDGYLDSYDYLWVWVLNNGTGNRAPEAGAGPNRYVKVNESVHFNGSFCSDPDGDDLYYKWFFGDGTDSGWLSVGYTSHVYKSVGNYTFRLNVTDGEYYAEDYATAYVSAEEKQNRAPVAYAGKDQSTSVNQTVTLNGNGSYDPDNDSLQYAWDYGDSTNSTWKNQPTTTHTYALPGTYTVTLTVSDGSLTDTDTCNISVSVLAINKPPVAIAGPVQNATVDELVYFDGGGSYDPDGGMLTYRWYFGDGTESVIMITPNTVHIYNASGTYTVTLEVSDGEFTSTDTTIVNVKAKPIPNNLPYFTSSPVLVAYVDIEWSYSPEASDPDVDDTIEITLESGPPEMIMRGSKLVWTPSLTYKNLVIPVKLEATDGKASVYQTFNITVKRADEDRYKPPNIVSTDPVMNSTDISITSNGIRITFSEPMDRTSVESSLSITPSMSYNLYWSNNDTVLLIVLKNDLPYNTSFMVALGTGASDLDGMGLESQFALMFKTVPKTPDVIVDPDGEAPEDDPEDSSTTNLMGIVASIAVIIVAIIFIVMFMLITRNRRVVSEVADDGVKELDDRRMLEGDKLGDEYGKYEAEAGADLDYISSLKNETLDARKPSDFGPTKEEILNKIKSKYEKGEISQETYNSIEKNLTER